MRQKSPSTTLLATCGSVLSVMLCAETWAPRHATTFGKTRRMSGPIKSGALPQNVSRFTSSLHPFWGNLEGLGGWKHMEILQILQWSIFFGRSVGHMLSSLVLCFYGNHKKTVNHRSQWAILCQITGGYPAIYIYINKQWKIFSCQVDMQVPTDFQFSPNSRFECVIFSNEIKSNVSLQPRGIGQICCSNREETPSRVPYWHWTKTLWQVNVCSVCYWTSRGWIGQSSISLGHLYHSYVIHCLTISGWRFNCEIFPLTLEIIFSDPWTGCGQRCRGIRPAPSPGGPLKKAKMIFS